MPDTVSTLAFPVVRFSKWSAVPSCDFSLHHEEISVENKPVLDILAAMGPAHAGVLTRVHLHGEKDLKE
jgi:hypothetical protein